MPENPSGAEDVKVVGDQWDTVAASQTARVIGSGLVGGYLSHLLIVPETTSPGAITLVDGSNGNIVFAGGASSVTSLVPFTVVIGSYAVAQWKVTTGTNVHVIVVGRFG